MLVEKKVVYIIARWLLFQADLHVSVAYFTRTLAQSIIDRHKHLQCLGVVLVEFKELKNLDLGKL